MVGGGGERRENLGCGGGNGGSTEGLSARGGQKSPLIGGRAEPGAQAFASKASGVREVARRRQSCVVGLPGDRGASRLGDGARDALHVEK